MDQTALRYAKSHEWAAVAGGVATVGITQFAADQLTDVTYLELQPYDEQTWTRDAYNDAIVSIFTRLNTAGRTLTREEITLAWLKVGWQTEQTGDKSAGECFSHLQTLLADQNLPLETDELVSAASFVWAVADNSGHLLANSDLLKGSVIRPMAAALSKDGIRTVDLRESLAGIPGTYRKLDGHWSQKGEAIVADRVALELKSLMRRPSQ